MILAELDSSVEPQMEASVATLMVLGRSSWLTTVVSCTWLGLEPATSWGVVQVQPIMLLQADCESAATPQVEAESPASAHVGVEGVVWAAGSASI